MPAGLHLQLALSCSKHGTYPFNPNFWPIFRLEIIANVYFNISLLSIDHPLLATILFFVADGFFFGCVVERFTEQAGQFAQTRRDTDDRIYLNRFNGSSWTGWGEICCGGITPSGPDVDVFGTELFAVARGTDDGVHLHRLNGNWSGWYGLPGTGLTPDDPAINTFGNSQSGRFGLWVYTRTTDDRIVGTRVETSSQPPPAPPPPPDSTPPPEPPPDPSPCLSASPDATTELRPKPC